MPIINIALNVPTGMVADLKAATRYTDTVKNGKGNDIPNPVTLKQHVIDRVILPSLRQRVRMHKERASRQLHQTEVENLTAS